MAIFITGPLGVGKTTTAKTVANKLKGLYISIDAILAEHALDQIPEGSHCIPLQNFLQANQYIVPKVLAALKKNQIVILDGCFYHAAALSDLQEKISPPHAIFTLQAPMEICIQRDATRAKPLGEHAARAVYQLTSVLTLGIPLDATRPLEENVQKILTNIMK